MRELHDKYFKLAKKEGHLARSYYKLEEIDKRCRLFRKGDRVLDIGACPGSWLEYILSRIGEEGVACAVDLNVIHKKFKSCVTFRQKDIREVVPEDFAEVATQFDVMVSDMAPKTSGVKTTDQCRSLELCAIASELADKMLKPGGCFVCKVLEGPDFPDFRAEMAKKYGLVRTIKPDASRDESMETYLVCNAYGEEPRKVKTGSNVNQRRKLRKKKKKRQGF
ncbi:MAG: RlmE family RNA methyltransferase [Planctomycetes bacterium]|nr:RlmE family RNA methyltransferase [Planctomycetota bacterium]